MSFSVKKTGGRMWHEARKQEKKIRGMLVDYRRRAERRRDYYEKIKSDPTQFLQLHGRPCKIHLDASIAAAANSPVNIMPWQGNQDTLIDRFDARAHLDWIPEASDTIDVETALTSEDRHINYESYRIVVQNEFLGVPEEKFLNQIHLEEQFGCSAKLDCGKDKKKSANNAAIGYNYETHEPIQETVKPAESGSQEEKDDEDSDVDLDICVDVSQIEPAQAHEMNQVAQKYGLIGADYFSYLTQDFEEAETLRQARKQEEEKAMYSGRRSRRERRAFREKKMIGRVMSPPSYAARESPDYNPYRKSSSLSRSRSASPENTGQITYITSFGGEEEDHGTNSQANPISPKKLSNLHLRKKRSESPRIHERTSSRKISKSSSRTRSRSLSRSRSYRGRDRRRSLSRSRSRRLRYRKKSRSRSRSRWTRSRTGSESRRSRSSSSRSTRSRSRSRRRRSKRRTSSSSSYSRSRSWSKSYRSRSNDSYRRRRYSDSKSESRSNSRSRSKVKSRSKSRSRSNSSKRSKSPVTKAAPLPRYYGRRGKSSSLELEISDDDNKAPSTATQKLSVLNSNANKPRTLLSTNSGDGHKVYKITPQERLKKKMQALLNKQYKADKKAEQMRIEKMEQQRQDREDEMREMSLKLRRKQRERRHRNEGPSSGSRSSSSHSRSRSPRSSTSRRDRRERDHRSSNNDKDKDRDRDRDKDRERDRRDDREKRQDSRRRRRDLTPKRSSPKTSRALVDY